MSGNAGAMADSATPHPSRFPASTRPSKSLSSTPSWQYTIRKLLSNLSKTTLTDVQLSDLHISVAEEDESSIQPSLETCLGIDAFFATTTYQGAIRCLPRDFQTRPKRAKACSEWVISLCRRWAQKLGEQHSEDRIAFQRAENALRITGDTRTQGVKTALTIQDVKNGHSIAILIRNRRRHESQLNSTELYTLLALADKQRLARPSANSYKVQIIVIHVHWIQRLSVQIPSSFLNSIIRGKYNLIGNITIYRSPWFNFMEEPGRRSVLQAIFEQFPLNTTCTHPQLPPVPNPKRKWDNDTGSGPAMKKRRTPRARGHISATPSARIKDV